MNTKHFFVSALDISEQLPFVIKKKKNLQEGLKEHDRAKEELNKFIEILEKYFKEDLSYIGMDVIGEKSYERFMFKNSGFFEAMVEAPIALNAHFPERKRAAKFCAALKKTLEKVLPKGPSKDMFIDSIQVQSEEDSSLSVEKWDIMKEMRV